MIATPMYGGMCYGQYTKSLQELTAMCCHYGIDMRAHFLFNESLITRARNYCVDEFMRSEYTHLLFIDSDITFRAEDVLAMLALQSDDSPYDVLAATYPKKCITWEKIVAAVNKGLADEDPNVLERFVGDFVFNSLGQGEVRIDEPVEVLEAGTGFMMIRRATFEKYEKAYPEYHYKPDHVRTENFDGSREIMAYFDCVIDRGWSPGDARQILELLQAGKTEEATALANEAINRQGSNRYLSEDYTFCQLARKAGMHVYMAPWIHLAHSGYYTFAGNLVDIARLGESPTVDPAKMKHLQKKGPVKALPKT